MAKSLVLLAVVATLVITSSGFKFTDHLDQFKQLNAIMGTKGGQDWEKVIRDAFKTLEEILPNGEADIQELLAAPSVIEMFKEKMLARKANANYSILNCSVGESKDFFKFTSWPVGQLGKNVKSTQTIVLDTLGDDCWEHITADFKLTGKNSYEVTLIPVGKKNLTLCSNTYTLASSRAMSGPISLTQTTTITVNDANDEQMTAIHNFGLYVYRFCDSPEHILPDLYVTLLLFIGGLTSNPDIPYFGSHPAFWQDKLNPEFILQGNTYQWRTRKDVFVDLDETEVKSGDFIIITRMDGVDQLIQFGAGSIVGHSVTLLEFDGEMYAVESQDGWYWPKHGIQRNPWKQWKKWAQNAGFNVAILPLSDEQRAKFNLTAAVDFFKSLEGYPYGYHNFLFGWIDKVSENIPPITTINYLYVLFALLERYIPGPVVSFMGEALNKRLNTTGLNLYQITNVLYEKNMTLEELFNIPEQDGWIYSDGPSYVCSAFVAGVYKAAGLFGNLTIQATEFTPRDVYQLNFFNATGKPAKCAGVDDDLPYCQIMGKFKMDILSDQWNSKAPYQNMFEKCPSMPPYYNRPDDC